MSSRGLFPQVVLHAQNEHDDTSLAALEHSMSRLRAIVTARDEGALVERMTARRAYVSSRRLRG